MLALVLLFKDVKKNPDFFHPSVLPYTEKLSQGLKTTDKALNTTTKFQGRNLESEKVKGHNGLDGKSISLFILLFNGNENILLDIFKLTYLNVSLDRTY